jgi:hypothetical protein
MSGFEGMSSFIKEGILRERSAGILIWLINGLWIHAITSSWCIVAFVDQRVTIVLDGILIRRTRPEAHEKHAQAGTNVEVHSTLKTEADSLTHFQIRDDVRRVLFHAKSVYNHDHFSVMGNSAGFAGAKHNKEVS